MVTNSTNKNKLKSEVEGSFKPKANFLENNSTLGCKINKKNLEKKVEVINVTLVLENGDYTSTQLSTNFKIHLLFNDPIDWKNSSKLTKLNKPIEFNASFPTSELNYHMQCTTIQNRTFNVSCDFVNSNVTFNN